LTAEGLLEGSFFPLSSFSWTDAGESPTAHPPRHPFFLSSITATATACFSGLNRKTALFGVNCYYFNGLQIFDVA